MKKMLCSCAIVILLSLMAGTAMAIPAKPGRRIFSQPDGSTFIAELRGDEHFSFAETPEGRSVIRNSQGWWTYARVQNRLLVPSALIAGRDECNFPLHLRPNAEAVAKIPGNEHKEINRTAAERAQAAVEFFYGKGGTKQNPKSAPSGRQYVNVLLGDFTDSTFAHYAAAERAGTNPYNPFPYSPAGAAQDSIFTQNHFWGLAFGDSVTYNPDSSVLHCLSNFYWDMTFHKCLWYGGVAMKSSGRTRAQSITGQSPQTTYLQAVVTACDASINYYTGGSMNNLMIVHPGPGQEESANTGDIWSMSMTGISLTNADGGNITKCIVVPQNAQLGVFCHELFHQATGGPDLYDYGYSGTPYGPWSLMDNGSWNGVLVSGDAPAFPGAYLEYDCDGNIGTGVTGWLTQSDSISSAKNGDGEYVIAALDSCGEARRGNVTSGVRLWRVRNNNFRDSGQVFLVENRRQTPPYEIGLPGEGIIITHIDTRMGGGSRFNDGPPNVRDYYAWVESPGFDPNPLYAAGDSLFPRSADNAAYSANAYSPGGYVMNRIDSTTIPNSWIDKSYASTPARTGPWIYDISQKGPYMSFSVLRSGRANTTPLVNLLTATVLDPLAGGGANNNNGLLDPWETDSIKLTFHNDSIAITACQCSLYVIGGAQYVSVTPGWQNVGSIAINGQAASGPFVVTVNKNTPRFTDVMFAVKVTGTPSFTDTSNFSLRISPFNIVQTYDFSNIAVGGAGFSYRLQPSDCAIWHDTLYVANANLNFATLYNRIHKVRRNASTPVIAADTSRSINNNGAINSTSRYIGGIDADSTGNLWYSLADSVLEINRVAPIPTVTQRFLAPNVLWAGNTTTTMKRIRGIGMGPSVVDTIGGSPNVPGDSLWVYWQKYGTNGANPPTYTDNVMTESLYVIQKGPANGTSTIRYRFGFADSAWGAYNYGAGYTWWNGRAIEYDGENIWTTSMFGNKLIRRRASDARITMVMPGPSTFGSYGTYGIAHEATDAAGTVYAPSGTVTYKPYQRGNIHYLYCCSMDEGKIYKILATDFFVPTPCDSVVARFINATTDRIVLYKHNADTQKVYGYIICGRTDTGTPNPATDSLAFLHSSRTGSAVSSKDSITITHAKAKATYYYSVIPINYGGSAGWGASVPANPLAVTLTDFSCALVSGNMVTLRWATASEDNVYHWVVERSNDGVAYTRLATVQAGQSPMGNKYTYTDNLPEPGMYYYRIGVVEMDAHGLPRYYDPLVVTFGAPTVYEMGQNFPNPMGTSATTIKYALKAPGQTSLKVYNVMGEAVRTLVDQHQGANYYAVHWDGRDASGRDVANGIYFYKLISGDFSSTKKMLVLR